MSVTVRAKYDDKVLKPYQDLHLNDGEEVQIKIQRNLADKIEAISIAGWREFSFTQPLTIPHLAEHARIFW
ncbi:MAG: antitoxin family protein [Methanothrix sp.]